VQDASSRLNSDNGAAGKSYELEESNTTREESLDFVLAKNE
jgi:hypothetical protein